MPTTRRNKVCPPGTILVKRATRKTPRVCGKGIGPLKKGELGQFGYHNVLKISEAKRHSMLDKAVEKYTALSIFRKLNALYVYTRRSSPGSSAIFFADRNWVREQYMKKK
jgi:hypothetical protein